jgi:hypothetical protein
MGSEAPDHHAYPSSPIGELDLVRPKRVTASALPVSCKGGKSQNERMFPAHHIGPPNPLDSRNKNLPEESIHRNYAISPGGKLRRVFCCTDQAASGLFPARSQKDTPAK